MPFPQVKYVLVDRRNVSELLPTIIRQVVAADFTGLDIETHDDGRHAGLNNFMKVSEETRKKAGNKRLVFDTQRTVITGFSVYAEGSDTGYYFNLAHADVENRLTWEVARHVLTARRANAYWVCHNATYELTMFGNSVGFELSNVIDTLQLCVSCYGPDEVSWDRFIRADLGEIGSLIPALRRASVHYDSNEDRQFTGELAEIAGKITGKESTAGHSYNGFIANLAWGYSLKKAVKQHFGHEMVTFEKTLGTHAHMGQLTGEEVVAYGAEDSVAAVVLFRHVLGMMTKHAPNAVKAFFETENQMPAIYSDIWRKGVNIDLPKVFERREIERIAFAQHLRDLKAVLRAVQFRPEPDPRLLKHEGWYAKNVSKLRAELLNWIHSPDSSDAYEQCQQIRSPVSNAWATDLGQPESSGPNVVHYYRMRTILYDLLRLPLEFSQGKVQSDGDSRGNLKLKAERAASLLDDETMVDGWKATAPAAIKALTCLNAMSGAETRIKLFISPYIHLVDPDTRRMYPSVSSTLATRRMAASSPNPQQLAKRGESTYIRGFFLPDSDDHVIISRDWSGIELVAIGEMSGDPEFAKVFSQLPHGDLHSGAAADILAVEVLGLNETMFKDLKKFKVWGDYFGHTQLDAEKSRRLTYNLTGEAMLPDKAYKYWRTEIGKSRGNFAFWYSGWLGTCGEAFGWSQDTTAEAVRRYTERFIVAEDWRRSVIQQGITQGWVELRDGHRRYKMEATQQWLLQWLRKWPLDDRDPPNEGFNGVVREIARKIQKRANNQLVNAMVQGFCAALLKRTLLRIKAELKRRGWTDREARFLFPIHDEVLYSVHRERVHEFLELSQHIMADHKDLFPTLALDSSPAIGLNFEPFDAIKAPYGQIELYEPPALVVGEKLADTRLNRDGVDLVLDYLFHTKKKAAA